MRIQHADRTQTWPFARRRSACDWRFQTMAVLLLLAMLLRALVPQGYMPAASTGQDALFAMVVCTPDGPMDASGSNAFFPSGTLHTAPDPVQPEHASALCSFSALAWQIVLDGLWQTLLLIVLLQAVRIVRPRYAAPSWAPRVAIRGARAPPASV